MKRQRKLIYINEIGESAEFSLGSIFHVNISRDVEGLTANKNDIYAINSMGQDGETFIGARLEPRDITIIGHIREHNASMSATHQRRLLHVLNPKYSGILIHEADGMRRIVNCVVEQLPDIKEGIFAEFTVMLWCEYPLWREEIGARDDVASWVGGFEFDEEEGLELLEFDEFDDDAEAWEIGWREPSIIVNVVNDGDWSAGFRAELRALGTLTNPSILNVGTGEFIKTRNLTMVSGDMLTISTGYGDKRITLTRNEVETDAFSYWDIDSTFFELTPGDNLLKPEAETGGENLEVTIHRDIYYLGVM